MTRYKLTEWATRPFSRTWTSIVEGNFSKPRPALRPEADLLCYDRNASSGAIFVTVKIGLLNNGLPVLNGPVQVGSALTFKRRWSQIVAGPFGKSGAQLLCYDASTGVGEFFGLDANGNLKLINRNTGWRTTWTQIVAGKFSDDDGLQLLFYDAAAGTGEFWAVEKNASLRLIRSITDWRNRWYSIVRGKFSGNEFDDLLFYDKAAGTGEFWHTDGHGGMRLFSSRTGWRTTWRGIKAGAFDLNSNYDGLLFFEDRTGYTEFYATDGKGGISLLHVQLGALWPSKAARWKTVLAGNFIGAGFGGLSDLVGYDASDTISYFQLVPHV